MVSEAAFYVKTAPIAGFIGAVHQNSKAPIIHYNLSLTYSRVSDVVTNRKETYMNKRQKSRFMFWGRWGDRHGIVSQMEAFQDLIVIFLCLGLFCVMVIQLFGLFSSLIHSVEFQKVTAHILFLLILVELFRLLMIYLQEHSVSVGVAVEVTIVSVLREVIVHGVLEVSWTQILAISGLLFILGALLMVCAKTPHMDHLSVAPERHAMQEPANHLQHEPEIKSSVHFDKKF